MSDATPADEPLVDVLRRLDLFAPLPAERLEQLARSATEIRLAAGEFLVREGDPPTRFNVIAEGEIEWTRTVAGETFTLGRTQAPTYTGTLNMLTREPSPAFGRAATAVRAFCFGAETFDALIRDEPTVLQEIARQFRPVYQGVESALREREKLAALGRLSAGLAHELNNPAAAARRSAADLGEALAVLQQTLARFVSSGVERTEAAELVALQQTALERAAAGGPVETFELADRTDELTDVLDDLGLEGWRLAPALAEANLDAEWVEDVARHAGPALEAALGWVVASLTARGLVEQLHSSVARVSELVSAVKAYTYMDRGRRQDVDVHAGIETTLTILGHKLREGRIEVVRDYDRELPRLEASGSELNQVWTNLIDNAIDAIDGGGTIRIATRRADEAVEVEVADDGPGIPPEVQARLFEPFFTTKDVGQGTGLGLDIARRIVQAGHRGTIEVRSAPGDTRFIVRLPLQPDPAPAPEPVEPAPAVG